MQVLSQPSLVAPARAQQPRRVARSRMPVRVWAEGEQEAQPAAEPAPKQPPPRTAYIDELPEIKRTELSPEMKAKLRAEYLGLGGSPNKAMGQNWFLNIILIIGGLAVLSWLTGAI